MKYFLIAGEASGDLHGGNLMKEILSKDSSAVFQFFGGDKMEAIGGTNLKHYKEMAFMGFVEVLLNIKTIKRNIRLAKESVLAFRPDVLILIDYPGFNLRIAEFAKANGIKVHYYISPKVWAWKESRVKKIKAYVDELITILPFETAFFKKHNLEVNYVGNPLLDAVKNWKASNKTDLSFDRPVLALLPGSRRMEIKNMLPTMLEAAREFPDYKVVLAGTNVLGAELYKQYIDGSGVEVDIVYNNAYGVLDCAHMAMVTSGTATLETAIFKLPQVVCYRANSLTVFIARMLVKIKYISLVNLIQDKMVVKELIQGDLTAANIKKELNRISDGEGRSTMIKEYNELYEKLGGEGASERAATVIINKLND